MGFLGGITRGQFVPLGLVPKRRTPSHVEEETRQPYEVRRILTRCGVGSYDWEI